jgi:hypothetical protein
VVETVLVASPEAATAAAMAVVSVPATEVASAEAVSPAEVETEVVSLAEVVIVAATEASTLAERAEAVPAEAVTDTNLLGSTHPFMMFDL